MDTHETFGPWKLLDRLAEGGMAVTWLARAAEAPAGHEVVIKRIHPELLSDEDLQALFVEEARMARRLDHPNLVRTFAAGEADGEQYLAMEYVWGEDLRRIAERGTSVGKPLPLRICVRMIADAARGLHAFHALENEEGSPLSPVHRDVSPPNLMLTYDGQTRVIDFGIAKVESRFMSTRPGQLKGKFGYMSPEQVQGLEIDRRSDIFALGVVLWEITTMRRLFKADSDVLTMKLVSEARVMAPHLARHDYPPALGEIVMRALARDPRQRYQTAGELADALEAFLEETQIAPTPEQIRQYMVDIFPDRIDALEGLLGAGYSGPVPTPTLPEIQEPATAQAPPTATPEPDEDTAGAGGSAAATGTPSSTGEAADLPDDGDDSILRDQRQSRVILGVFAVIAIGVAAWVAYTLFTHGGGTRVADIEPSAPIAAGEIEPAAAPTTVLRTVQTDPPGARVILNGIALPGVTPLEVPFVEDAPNDLAVALAGHRTVRRVLPRGGQDALPSIALIPLTAPEEWEAPTPETQGDDTLAEDDAGALPITRLHVVTTHAGRRLPEASVALNGNTVEGATPLTLEVPADVPVHVTARMQDFRDSTVWVMPRETRRPGEQQEILIELTRADQAQVATTLRLQLNPPDATVLLAGEPTAGRTHTLRAPGHYPVRVEAEGYRPWEAAFSTGPGVISERVVLEPIPVDPARLSLSVTPPETQIYAARVGDPAGARRVGTSELEALELASGEWELTLLWRDADTRLRGRTRVTLSPGVHHRFVYTLDEDGATRVEASESPVAP